MASSTQSKGISELLSRPCVRKMSEKLVELLKAGLWAVGEPFWELMDRPFSWRYFSVQFHVGGVLNPFHLLSLLLSNYFRFAVE
jgi:hypothetical protein